MLKTVLELKEEVRDWIDLEIAAFPQEGTRSYPEGVDLLQEALKRFFIESIGQLREELTEFKKENPNLPWSGGEPG